MEGSVRKRGNTWYYSFEGAKVDGKRQRIERVGGKTKTEALTALRKAISDYENGDQIDLSNISVADYFDYWYKDYVVRNLRPNTQSNYENVIDKHINPKIGKYKLKSMGPAKLQQLVDSLPNSRDKPLAKHTVHIIISVLRTAFKKAVYPYELIKNDPMRYVEAPRMENNNLGNKKIKIVTIEQYQEILNFFLPGSPARLPFIIAFHTGLRRGEVLGLTWADVSFSDKTVSINKQLIEVRGQGIQLAPLKSPSSYRTISIDDTLIKALKKIKVQQSEDKLRHGRFYFDSNFITRKENGEPYTPNSIKHLVAEIKNKRNIDFNFHILRHTHATMLLEDGVPPKTVQERLGHSNISMTLNTYAHVTKKMQTEATDIFHARIQRENIT